jgi:hypothetical protein
MQRSTEEENFLSLGDNSSWLVAQSKYRAKSNVPLFFLASQKLHKLYCPEIYISRWPPVVCRFLHLSAEISSLMAYWLQKCKEVMVSC